MSLIHINKNNYEHEVNDSDIPVIIDFWASWCGPCQMMGPVFEELSSEYTGRLKFAKLNTEEEPALAGKFGISGIPCLIITTRGKETGRIVGFAPKEILKQKIQDIIGGI